MNGGHDLGGMHGLGPINPEPETEEPIFHAEWERRVFGLTLAASALGKWNIDKARHARERQHPADYLKHSYYENWLVGLETLLVESGLVTSKELNLGKAIESAEDSTLAKVLQGEEVSGLLARGGPTAMPSDDEPRFKPGDRVQVINRHPQSHTRLPGYVRGRQGVVEFHEGAHVYPDRNAKGLKEGRHLYRVRFAGAELWGEDANQQSVVFVDLWQDYLEPA